MASGFMDMFYILADLDIDEFIEYHRTAYHHRTRGKAEVLVGLLHFIKDPIRAISCKSLHNLRTVFSRWADGNSGLMFVFL